MIVHAKQIIDMLQYKSLKRYIITFSPTEPTFGMVKCTGKEKGSALFKEKKGGNYSLMELQGS